MWGTTFFFFFSWEGVGGGSQGMLMKIISVRLPHKCSVHKVHIILYSLTLQIARYIHSYCLSSSQWPSWQFPFFDYTVVEYGNPLLPTSPHGAILSSHEEILLVTVINTVLFDAAYLLVCTGRYTRYTLSLPRIRHTKLNSCLKLALITVTNLQFFPLLDVIFTCKARVLGDALSVSYIFHMQLSKLPYFISISGYVHVFNICD